MNVWHMSLYASALVLAVIAFRALAGRRVHTNAVLALWSAALLRLLIPVSLPWRFSLFSLAEQAEELRPEPSAAVLAPEAVRQTVSMQGALPPAAEAAARFPLWAVVWLVGAAVCAVYFLAAHLRGRIEYGAAIPVSDRFAGEWLSRQTIRRTVRIHESDRIQAPLTYGILRPVILLPKSTDWGDERALNHVLTHEMEHIRRFDVLFKGLLAAAACVHWFNPLVWVMLRLANRDIELSCDERVLRELGESEKTAYAMTLIRLEEDRSRLSALSGYFAKNAVEERIVAIMKYKKRSLTAVIVSALVVVGITSVLATTPPEDTPVILPPEPSFAAEMGTEAPTSDEPAAEEGFEPGDDSYAKYAEVDFPPRPWNLTPEYDQALIEEIARLDIDSAPEHMREAILEARLIVTTNVKCSWAYEPENCALVDMKTGEKAFIWDYSDLFPDWNLPEFTSDTDGRRMVITSAMYDTDTDRTVKFSVNANTLG